MLRPRHQLLQGQIEEAPNLLKKNALRRAFTLEDARKVYLLADPPGVCRRAAGGRGRRLGRSFRGRRSLGDQGLEQREVLTGAGLDLVS